MQIGWHEIFVTDSYVTFLLPKAAAAGVCLKPDHSPLDQWIWATSQVAPENYRPHNCGGNHWRFTELRRPQSFVVDAPQLGQSSPCGGTSHDNILSSAPVVTGVLTVVVAIEVPKVQATLKNRGIRQVFLPACSPLPAPPFLLDGRPALCILPTGKSIHILIERLTFDPRRDSLELWIIWKSRESFKPFVFRSNMIPN